MSADRRLEPARYLADLVQEVPELGRLAEVDAEILMNLDSTEMTPSDWTRIARHLGERMDRYDGFVVVHGTDTMAYTASALSFALSGLRKPVVVTGSLRPLRAIPTDARLNLVSAVDVARRDVPEVAIFFGRHLLRGNRARKASVERYDAFESPNYPPLARVGLDVDLHDSLIRRPTGPFVLREAFDPAVATLACWPGAPASLVDRAADGARALVVAGYGTGNLPGGEAGWPGAVARAVRRGVPVLLVSQCPHGAVRLPLYAVGRAALDAGAVPGADLTVEAAVAKTMHLLARGLSGEALRDAWVEDLAGELTAEKGPEPARPTHERGGVRDSGDESTRAERRRNERSMP
jgi:L-asparaginase